MLVQRPLAVVPLPCNNLKSRNWSCHRYGCVLSLGPAIMTGPFFCAFFSRGAKYLTCSVLYKNVYLF